MRYWFQELYKSYRDYRGANPMRDVFEPTIVKARSAVDEFRPLARPDSIGARPIDQTTLELLWNLYALSRVVDLALLSFQPSRIEAPTPVAVTTEELSEFMVGLGFTIHVEQDFRPFFHEIVDLADETESNPSIENIFWPSFFLDDLLFLRSGVSITAPARSYRKSVCENSVLYWSFIRRNRPTEDLSMGWGSNSQWRTKFRRDLIIGDTLIYNADGELRLGDGSSSPSSDPGRDDMPDAAWIDLIRHRCFVLDEVAHEPWPYSYRVEESRL